MKPVAIAIALLASLAAGVRAQTNNLLISTSSLSFTYQAGSPSLPPSQTVTILTSGSSVPFTATASTTGGGSWLAVSPVSGNTPANLSVSVNPAGLPTGTYNGTVTINAAGATNSPQSVPVTLTVTTSSELQTSAPQGGITLTGQTGSGLIVSPLVISSTGSPLSFTIAASAQGGGSWLTVDPSSGTTPATVSVRGDTTGLSPGTYTGTVTITAPGASNSPRTIPVTFTVNATPTLTASPASLTFNFQTGGTAPAAQSVAISAGGSTAVPFTATATTNSGGSWLTVTPVSGNTPATLSVSVNVSGLTPGTYTGNVAVTSSSAANTLNIGVTLVVSNNPLLNVSPQTVTFNYQTGGAIPATQSVSLSSTGPVLPFAASASTQTGGSWLLIAPISGTTPATLSIAASPVGLAPGTYSGTVSVAATGAGNSPQTINVVLNVSQGVLLNLSPNKLDFAVQPGGVAPPLQTLNITASDGSAIAVNVSATTAAGGNWLIAAPLSGTTPAAISVGINPQGLAVGAYSGTITVTSANAVNSPQSIPVNLVVAAQNQIVATPSSITFSQPPGGPAPATQTIQLGSATAGLTFVANASTNSGGQWLTVTPNTGTIPSSLTVGANTTGLAAGVYTGSITVVASGASNPITIPVTLVVGTQPVLAVSASTLNFSARAGGSAPQGQQITVSSGGTPVVFVASSATTSGGAWLSVTPQGGTTPANLTVNVNPASLAPGNYSGTVTVAATGATSSPQTVTVNLSVAAAPVVTITSMTNAASFLPAPAVPGLIVSFFGTDIGPATPVGLRLTAAGTVDTNIGDVRVLFDGVAAPLTFVSRTQVNAVVPYEVFGRFSTRVRIEFQGVRSNELELRVADTFPGIFALNPTGAGQGAILNQNGTVNSPVNPADRDSIIVIYATGEGQTRPAGITGRVIGSDLRNPMAEVRVRIGGQLAVLEYAGSAPGFVSGVLQVNARVPSTVTPGNAVPVELEIGSVRSQAGITAAIR